MNSYKKRKGRRIGGEDGSELRASQEQDPEVSGQKPSTNLKRNLKLRLSFEPDPTGMISDDRSGTGIRSRKTPSGRSSAANASVFQESLTGKLSPQNPTLGRLSQGAGPVYDLEHLKELQISTLSPLRNVPIHTHPLEEQITVRSGGECGQTGENSALFIHSPDANVREGMEGRMHSAMDQDYISLESKAENTLIPRPRTSRSDRRLVPDAVNFTADFEDSDDTSALPLSMNMQGDKVRRRRTKIQRLIDEAETASEGNGSECARGAIYEIMQLRAGMEGLTKGRESHSRLDTPAKVTPIPSLSSAIEDFYNSLALTENCKSDLIQKLEILNHEEIKILEQKKDIQSLLKHAGNTYEHIYRT
ncbi:autophagy protein 6 [Coccidioides posadasii str. Silveira]|uniref:Uncharacterized protein n=3 Tax=Coccidioides posadasii TaxID=199306 RepID=E9DAE6_COCPS|nr:hypothetical protein CPC735_044770 [Coccidioides posadasii C735 delta SOWgp]EER23107.1 hypothetical protein CPC735_044770 [Coccidioides posadasii C735 delta SOWgp]EFW16877.1 conserved hypothetical protein [Coccidioides posadasii str. Silveira]KMM64363.1 hypothetical protein CPAG_00715 [Coccidioides posadasii RMSCC 3488]QVM06469.1 autophagy protein 6 [Coccidioides posadasii str. Silveira]|eukprot:XP_003065252.1 hypothetical protein CPC735_044770 [Coccidioides posadasii C735 delta SOWgp]